MGRRGPRKLPKEVKARRGTLRTPRTRKEVTPRTPTMSDPPTTLAAEGKRRWEETMRHLQEDDLVTVADLHALEVYCRAWDEVAACDKSIAEHGDTFETDKGYIGQSPAIARRFRAYDIIRRFQIEFGLTPAARQGVTKTNKSKPAGVSSFARKRK